MSSTVPMSLRKALEPFEGQFLKKAGKMLAEEKFGGRAAMADLLDIVASWHAFRGTISFSDYARRWVEEGNAGSPASDRLLRLALSLDPKGAA
ncbi:MULTISPECIES: hypothetical protein [unclassified Pseudomonas]|uniref:hypothetical protein n=1 Tax=unclassified Pseudomonas TaxID=196821 RepID=UPI002448847F|nr:MULTISPECIES: hypothetical protein [unclassified Pseudomonas]MDG9928276.1 hypothetical protein [Pseudomonas sp. GD04042]MDH0481160.1 hypothetical protein [Pseudomonas sp. GD04015]MDH0604496.1 hypothetical protein [Pseudomonas sp. GD03869]